MTPHIDGQHDSTINIHEQYEEKAGNIAHPPAVKAIRQIYAEPDSRIETLQVRVLMNRDIP